MSDERLTKLDDWRLWRAIFGLKQPLQGRLCHRVQRSSETMTLKTSHSLENDQKWLEMAEKCRFVRQKSARRSSQADICLPILRQVWILCPFSLPWSPKTRKRFSERLFLPVPACSFFERLPPTPHFPSRSKWEKGGREEGRTGLCYTFVKVLTGMRSTLAR